VKAAEAKATAKVEKEPATEAASTVKMAEKAEAASVEKKAEEVKAQESIRQEEAEAVPEYSARETKAEQKKAVADIVEDKTLPAPRLTEVNNSEKGVIHLHWEKVKKASGYVVYRKNAEEDIYKMYSDIKKNTFDDVEVEPDMIYYYRVRAFVQKGDKRVHGQLSPIESNGYSSRVKSKY
jgi:hypothetical protein